MGKKTRRPNQWDPAAIAGMILQGNDVKPDDAIEATVGIDNYGDPVTARLWPIVDGKRAISLQFGTGGPAGPQGEKATREFNAVVDLVMKTMAVVYNRQKAIDDGKLKGKIAAAAPKEAAGQATPPDNPPQPAKGQQAAQAGPETPGDESPAAGNGRERKGPAQ